MSNSEEVEIEEPRVDVLVTVRIYSDAPTDVELQNTLRDDFLAQTENVPGSLYISKFPEIGAGYVDYHGRFEMFTDSEAEAHDLISSSTEDIEGVSITIK